MAGVGSGYGSGSGDGYGDGDGDGYGDGYGDGSGYGYGADLGQAAGHDAFAHHAFGILTIGCQVHTVEWWREHWHEVAAAHGVEVTEEEARALLARLAAPTRTLISLFAGAGGEVLGGHRAGLEHVEAVEWDHDAANTLEFATGGGLFSRPHHAWDAPPLLVRRCSVADWTPAVADVWWASPPCQPDSVAGKRLGEDDPRDGWPMLFAAFDRAEVKPRWIVCETVFGILRSTATERWERIVAMAVARFPCVGWFVLDAADYGVPQHRRRVIMWMGPAPVDEPPPTHGEGRKPWVSMGEALGFVGVLDGGRNSANHPTQERPTPSTEPSPTDGGRGNQMMRIIGGGHNPSHPGDVRRYQDLTHRPSTTIAARPAGNGGPFVELIDRPSPCVSATEVKGSTWYERADSNTRENRASCRLDRITEGQRRRLTVAECAILQDFPRDWPFQGTLEQQYRQVGNAVPPTLAEVVLRQVLAADEAAT